jgi:hypothetical protein
MMNYAPDGMAAGGALRAAAWALAWCPDAVAVDSLPFSVGVAPERPAVRTAVFQPERMSGFCAAG